MNNSYTKRESADFMQVFFTAACAVVVLLPLVGMLWAPTETTTENRALAKPPTLIEDDGLNVDILSEWGAYFEDHFAFRNEMVSANAFLRANIVGVSATDSVVVGTDGWLYYAGTLGDYMGREVVSDRGAQNIAFNLSLMRGYCEAQGATFLFTVAPNKNTVYPSHMPYYYVAGSTSNLDILDTYLDDYNIPYLDLASAISSEESEVLYYQKDTHWNTKGALLASESITEALGDSLEIMQSFEPGGILVDDYVGDTNAMLYPIGAVPEKDYSYDKALSWDYLEGRDVTDSWIVTKSTKEDNHINDVSLLMYRDSFGNNMIPFFASAYHQAFFSKLVPYNLTQVGSLNADRVVIERAERHISDLGESPAIMPAPSVAVQNAEDAKEVSSQGVMVEEDGDYCVITGNLPQEYATQDVSIYICVAGESMETWFIPFHVTTEKGDFGYRMYVKKDVLAQAQEISVACGNANELVRVQKMDHAW